MAAEEFELARRQGRVVEHRRDEIGAFENDGQVIGEVDDMKPYENDGAYLNFAGFGEEGEDQLKTAYGANYTRLKAIKATYDPNNLFRSNLYILPAA